MIRTIILIRPIELFLWKVPAIPGLASSENNRLIQISKISGAC